MDLALVSEMRMVILLGATAWSLDLARRIFGRYYLGLKLNIFLQDVLAVSLVVILFGWISIFWL